MRLSKGSEESEPKEIKSGDIVQFGVDVVENSKKGLPISLIVVCFFPFDFKLMCMYYYCSPCNCIEIYKFIFLNL